MFLYNQAMKQYDLHLVSQTPFRNFHIEYGCVNGDFPVHTHDFCEIFLVLSGSGSHISGDMKYTLQKGELFSVKGSERHGFCDCRDLKIVNIMFQISSLQMQECKTLPGFWVLFLHEQQFGSISHITLKDHALEKVSIWCQNMMEEYHSPIEGSTAMCNAILTQLIIFLSRACEALPQNIDQPDYRLAKALIYLETHYAESVELQQLAQMVGFSTRHFSRLFQELYHKPPMHYLLQIRLEHARQLLAETDKSVAEIANLCGFSDSNYFSKIFKLQTLVSPMQWRKGNTSSQTTVCT